MSDVTEMLDQLSTGSVPLETVVADFSARTWPQRTPAEDELSDPEPAPEDSFSEVSGYYAMGKITDEQYAALADAATGAMKG